jgi:sarcosine oxidase delta subunit
MTESDDESDVDPADSGTTIQCPYCGEPNEISLDPAGGAKQDYVEDCQVCCQPWRVRVHYRRNGKADVSVEANDE